MNKINISTMASSKNGSSKRTAVRDIALKNSKDDDGFIVHHIQSEDLPKVEPMEENYVSEEQLSEPDFSHFERTENLPQQFIQESRQPEPMSEPKDFIKVKFSQFVQLVATHDLDEVMKNNEDEDVVLSSNLLTELASAHSESDGKKIPIFFLVGLTIGVVLTYILFSK